MNTFISLLSILTGKETVRTRFGFAKICRIPSSNFISFEASSSCCTAVWYGFIAEAVENPVITMLSKNRSI